MIDFLLPQNIFNSDGGKTTAATTVTNGNGAQGVLMACQVANHHNGGVVMVLPSMMELESSVALARFFAPSLSILSFPARGCLAYDGNSPNSQRASLRATALSKLQDYHTTPTPFLLFTTPEAVLPATLPPHNKNLRSLTLAVHDNKSQQEIITTLESMGYRRQEIVAEQGDYALRGGLIDMFPAGQKAPCRLDMFGDTIESLRTFDPITQRSIAPCTTMTLRPVGEIFLTPAQQKNFHKSCLTRFGVMALETPLVEAVMHGQAFHGMEQWLPLFYGGKSHLFDYLTPIKSSVPSKEKSHSTHEHAPEKISPTLLIDACGMENYWKDQWEYIEDAYHAHQQDFKDGTSPQTPPLLPPEELFLTCKQLQEKTHNHPRLNLLASHENIPDSKPNTLRLACHPSPRFSLEKNPKEDISTRVRAAIAECHRQGQRVLIVASSQASKQRLTALLQEKAPTKLSTVDNALQIYDLPQERCTITSLPVEDGFTTKTLSIITEKDIFGARLIPAARVKKHTTNPLTSLLAFSPKDLVVHAQHGIGRFEKLVTVDVGNVPHECALITYHGGNKLYLPVENIDLLSRYGSHGIAKRDASEDVDDEKSTVILDRLGSADWQERKARAKQRIMDMAKELMEIAAVRKMAHTTPIQTPSNDYSDFCLGFPFEETEDQTRAINDVIKDFSSGQVMERLVCGDVGFGKTEVALRAAFIATMAGFQVAIITPTTLLCHQHAKTFAARFEAFPIKIHAMSRFASAREKEEMRQEIRNGTADITIGSHALLNQKITFKNLGLLIIDEEQHFGVRQKELLKDIKRNVHVLTLTATPIPRTLQFALSGLQDLSVIATPPVNRRAIRTHSAPFNPTTIRHALLQEKNRHGQSFYVCPRIKDLDAVATFLQEKVPEVTFTTVHARLPTNTIEHNMHAFYEGRVDVLLATNIIDAGLDITKANTIIIHNAYLFGLAQLYQLRGRVGRGERRAYAYLTWPPTTVLTDTAKKRLEVLNKMDRLGMGFSIASHDMDIRGAGNLLGHQQSGHIREVGYELYQSMLTKAVRDLKEGNLSSHTQEKNEDSSLELDISPQVIVPFKALLPQSYIPDATVRMALYRRLATLLQPGDLEDFAQELQDRFGTPPLEVEELLKVVALKNLCRQAGVSKVEQGPRGGAITFHKHHFSNPAALVELIQKNAPQLRLQSDHKLVLSFKDASLGTKALKDLLETLRTLRNAKTAES